MFRPLYKDAAGEQQQHVPAKPMFLIVQPGDKIHSGHERFFCRVLYSKNCDNTPMKIVTTISILFVAAFAVHAQYSSVYTSLSTKACKEIRLNLDDGEEYEGACPGVGGYRLRLTEGDLRQSIDVMTPRKKRIPLAFWNITAAFNYVGQKAEWRLKGKTPMALIVRLTANKDPENIDKTSSMLVVSKVSATGACVTDVVEPVTKQNEIARKLADEATKKPCKYPKE